MPFFGDDVLDDIIFEEEDDDFLPLMSSSDSIVYRKARHVTRERISLEEYLGILDEEGPRAFERFYQMKKESFMKLCSLL